MRTVVGVFKSRSEAETGVNQLRSAGIPEDKINLLTPDHIQQEVAATPRVSAEQPGMVKAMGAVAGGAAGLGLGEGLATLLVPGVGPILAIGLAGGALLGALAGAAIGGASEKAIFSGLPEDELFVYEDALRQKRTVVVALTASDEQASTARVVMERAGAESIDRARHMWWVGVRDVEKEHYEAGGGNFRNDEAAYRQGFESAQHDGNPDQSARYPDTWNSEAFRQGYARGRKYREGSQQKAAAK